MKFDFDFSRLRGRIVEKYGSIENFSKKLSRTPFLIILTVFCVFVWNLLENNEMRYTFLAEMRMTKKA